MNYDKKLSLIKEIFSVAKEVLELGKKYNMDGLQGIEKQKEDAKKAWQFYNNFSKTFETQPHMENRFLNMIQEFNQRDLNTLIEMRDGWKKDPNLNKKKSEPSTGPKKKTAKATDSLNILKSLKEETNKITLKESMTEYNNMDVMDLIEFARFVNNTKGHLVSPQVSNKTKKDFEMYLADAMKAVENIKQLAKKSKDMRA